MEEAESGSLSLNQDVCLTVGRGKFPIYQYCAYKGVKIRSDGTDLLKKKEKKRPIWELLGMDPVKHVTHMN